MNVVADAPSRKKRPRAARITFPDPDRGRKPKLIPTLRFKTVEEWWACSYVNRFSPLWAIQRHYMTSREYAESLEARRLRSLRRDAWVAAVAVRSAAAVAATTPEAVRPIDVPSV